MVFNAVYLTNKCLLANCDHIHFFSSCLNRLRVLNILIIATPSQRLLPKALIRNNFTRLRYPVKLREDLYQDEVLSFLLGQLQEVGDINQLLLLALLQAVLAK